MKVLLWLPHAIRTFALQPEQLRRLELRRPEHDFRSVTTVQAFLSELPEADAALVWQFDADWYRLAPRLRFVATPAAGRELVRPDPSGRVRTVHGHFHGKIMAESLLAMMLYFSRRLDLCVENQRARLYDRAAFVETRRLSGQHALLVGYGPLARECARLLKAFGLRVTGVKRDAAVDPAPADALFALEHLRELLPLADHIVLTLPGDTATDGMIGERELALVQPSACLYNLGRGNAVDEAALVRALTDGRLAHAFLDVFAEEPLPESSPLWDAPRLAVMPHASAISRDYLDLWFEELADEQL
jgi:phosphoglycerate dehydrogenase-like enzyme